MRSNVALESLVDTHEQPFVVFDRNYKIVAVNRAFEIAYGVEREKAIGQSCFALCHHNAGPCFEFDEDCPHREVYRTLKPYSCLHTHYDAHGCAHWVRVMAYPLRGENGEMYMGEVMLELSVQKQTSESTARMVGKSPAFLAFVEQLKMAADSEAPVLLLGETGSGKELAANFIHEQSARRAKSFLTIDCPVIPETLFESEAFGHERGAYTGSVGEKKGLFECVDGGTLFLDEVTEISPSMQGKLLRVLETGEFRRVGGFRTLTMGARVIGATNRDIWVEVRAKRFREDLYYRLACICIYVPTLRERREDIPLLAETLLERNGPSAKKKCHLTPCALDRLKDHDYPGNIRELRNILHAAASECGPGQAIDAELIDKLLKSRAGLREPQNVVPLRLRPATSDGHQDPEKLRDIERRHIVRLLERHGGNRKQTADLLGISERTLYRKIKGYGLHGAAPAETGREVQSPGP